MKIIGHRGAKALAPENTLASFQKALEHGVDEVETDAHLTKDNIVVLEHDPVLHDAAGNKLVIADHTLAQLRTHKPDLATLEEALALVNRQVPFMIEIKAETCTAVVLQHIQALHEIGWTLPDITIASDNFKVLQLVHTEMPDITLSVIENWSGVRGTSRARKLGAKRLSMNQWALWVGFTGPLTRRGYQIAAYTVNTRRQAQRLERIGVQAIFTDDPSLFQ